MRGGKLVEARKMLVLCGGPQCPTVMHPDCEKWLASVEASMSTVVFQVSAKGGPPPEVHVTVDGGESMPYDGRALSMDPGRHEVSFVANGYVAEHRRVVVSEGEKLHRETVELVRVPELALARPGAAPAAEPSVHRLRITVPVVLASSAALAASVAAVIFGVKARRDDRALELCSPTCPRERADHVRSEYLWTNISIAVSVTGVATAAALLFLQGDASRPTGSVALGFDVSTKALAPTLSGKF
jgi:hypothetical protein